jgi:organic radical activating enzyme
MAKNGVFRTVQGEGAMLGVPMTFIRLAGCSIGCPQCDTDYKRHHKSDETAIVKEVLELGDKWAWITGGEPTDHDLMPLVDLLREKNIQVALATAGHRELPRLLRLNWLSVSPHDLGAWKHQDGSELKIVPGLNGMQLSENLNRLGRFGHRFVQPLAGDSASVQQCVQWVRDNPGWRMTAQAHKQWGLD